MLDQRSGNNKQLQFSFRANSCNSWATLPLHSHSYLNRKTGSCFYRRSQRKPAANSLFVKIRVIRGQLPLFIRVFSAPANLPRGACKSTAECAISSDWKRRETSGSLHFGTSGKPCCKASLTRCISGSVVYIENCWCKPETGWHYFPDNPEVLS